LSSGTDPKKALSNAQNQINQALSTF
jgi:hypothetical protein